MQIPCHFSFIIFFNYLCFFRKTHQGSSGEIRRQTAGVTRPLKTATIGHWLAISDYSKHVNPPLSDHPNQPAATLAMALSMALAAVQGEVQADTPDQNKLSVEVLLRDRVTWDGTELPAYAEGEPEITIVRLTVPPGATLPDHKHPVINGGVLLSGELTVRDEGGLERRLRAGNALLEVVDSWHTGRNTGKEPAVAIVFYVGAAGLPNRILRSDVKASAPVPLNSERIAASFGSYGVELLHQAGRCRVSNLYSTHGEATITRTLAVVDLPTEVPAALEESHAAILIGASLGATLKAAGWSIDKRLLWQGMLDAPAPGSWLGQLMQLQQSEPLAAELYRLELERDGTRFSYASIAEIHHPEHRDPLQESAADGALATPG